MAALLRDCPRLIAVVRQWTCECRLIRKAEVHSLRDYGWRTRTERQRHHLQFEPQALAPVRTAHLGKAKGIHMVIARAFFDESGTHDDEKNLCVAGYVFEGEADHFFDAEWREILAKYGLPYHHMREFGSQVKGVYQHLSWEDRERSRLEAIAIIRRHASCGFAFSFEKSSLEAIVKDSPWTNAYAFLANQAFYGVEQLLRGRESGLVDYVYEAGAEGWDEALKVFNDAKGDPGLERWLRLGTFASLGKAEATQLQAADLLSWSWLRERRRVDKGEKLGRHEEFRRLMNVPIDPHHWDAEAGEAIQWIKRVGGGDVRFVQWLTEGDSHGKFVRFLMRADSHALDYFRAIFYRERMRVIRGLPGSPR